VEGQPPQTKEERSSWKVTQVGNPNREYLGWDIEQLFKST